MLKKNHCLVAISMGVIFLAGCNDDDKGDKGDKVALYELNVMPSSVSGVKGFTQQMGATVKYSDGSQGDVSGSVLWEVNGDPTVAEVSESGLVTGLSAGSTTLVATKDGIFSNTVYVSVCESLAETCSGILDTGSGKLFTSSPSVNYHDSISGSAHTSTYSEVGSTGPSGDFYTFTQPQAQEVCARYNDISLGGRTNWSLPTKDELKVELVGVYGNMFISRGWPTSHYYWSSTPDGSDYYRVYLANGIANSDNPGSANYASCVSNP